jgi:hypothetical protein
MNAIKGFFAFIFGMILIPMAGLFLKIIFNMFMFGWYLA